MKRIEIDCGPFIVWADYAPKQHPVPYLYEPGHPMMLDIVDVLLPTGEYLSAVVDTLGAWDAVQSLAESCLARDLAEVD